MSVGDKEIAATEEWCHTDPLAARTRHALLKLERSAHRAGWGAKAALHKVEHHPTKHYVTIRPAALLTASLHLFAEHHCSGDVGEALQQVADSGEFARDVQVSQLGMPPTMDSVTATTTGHEFYGFALVAEVWTVPEADEAAMRAAAEKRLDEHPDRVDARMVYLVARDGLRWFVTRRRGSPPRVVMSTPDSSHDMLGLIPNGLGRLTNSVAANLVPIPARVDPEELDRILAERYGFTCPVCGKSSTSPDDAANGYCGQCHDWTGQPRG